MGASAVLSYLEEGGKESREEIKKIIEKADKATEPIGKKEDPKKGVLGREGNSDRLREG